MQIESEKVLIRGHVDVLELIKEMPVEKQDKLIEWLSKKISNKSKKSHQNNKQVEIVHNQNQIIMENGNKKVTVSKNDINFE